MNFALNLRVLQCCSLTPLGNIAGQMGLSSRWLALMAPRPKLDVEPVWKMHQALIIKQCVWCVSSTCYWLLHRGAHWGDALPLVASFTGAEVQQLELKRTEKASVV